MLQLVHDVVSQAVAEPPTACDRSFAPSTRTVSRDSSNLRRFRGSEFVIRRLVFFCIDPILVNSNYRTILATRVVQRRTSVRREALLALGRTNENARRDRLELGRDLKRDVFEMIDFDGLERGDLGDREGHGVQEADVPGSG